MSESSLWVCQRCSIAIRSRSTPTECYEDQGGCKRPAGETQFLGPFPDSAKDAVQITATYRRLRLEDGLTEPEALDVLDRERDEPQEVLRAVLAQSCLLDEWPVGWRDEKEGDEERSEWEKLADRYDYDEVEYWLGRVVDTSDLNLFLAPLLAVQGYLHPLLRAIGPAFHIIPVSGRFSAGKSRSAEILVYLGGGTWLASATVPALKSARKGGPIVIGIDEGDEAERDNPGVKAYLLASHDWDARYLKYSEPSEKGRRELIQIDYGGPVVVTFRKRPWPALASRAFVMEMEPSTRHEVSDDGSGDGFKRLLGPARIWLRNKCDKTLVDKNELWALRRTHEPDFLARLNRVTEKAELLRQRDFARTVLLIAELVGLNMERVEKRLTESIANQELESESATIIEAIESDPLFQMEEVGVEELRLSVQKFLRDRKEFVDLTRNRFADVLKEMDFSREKGPTWNRVRREGRIVTVILPGLWRKNREEIDRARQAKVEEAAKGSDTSATSDTTPYGGVADVAHVADPVAGPGRVYNEDDGPTNPDPRKEAALRRAHEEAIKEDPP